MIIDLSPECLRFDSVVEANEKGDPKALKMALESNLATINSILSSASSVWDRYEKTMLALLKDLEEINRIGDSRD